MSTPTREHVAGSEATRRRCKVGRLLDQSDDAGRDLFLQRLNADGKETGWTDRHLSKRLEAEAGIYVSPAMLSLHRTRLCVCSPDERHEDR